MNPNELAAYLDGTLCQDEDTDYAGAELCAIINDLQAGDFPRDRCSLTQDPLELQ